MAPEWQSKVEMRRKGAKSVPLRVLSKKKRASAVSATATTVVISVKSICCRSSLSWLFCLAHESKRAPCLAAAVVGCICIFARNYCLLFLSILSFLACTTRTSHQANRTFLTYFHSNLNTSTSILWAVSHIFFLSHTS